MVPTVHAHSLRVHDAVVARRSPAGFSYENHAQIREALVPIAAIRNLIPCAGSHYVRLGLWSNLARFFNAP